MSASTQIIEIDAEDFDTLLIFGGVYSNLQALEAVLEVADQLRLTPQQIICTGDTAAYCGDPEASLETARAAGIWHIKGNCEESLAESRADCGCGFEEGTLCSALSQSWFRYADKQITPHLRGWMAGLPAGLLMRFGGRRLAITHGTPRSINRFVFRSTHHLEKQEQLDFVGADAIVAGHCGLPFTDVLDDARVWHNSGAIGMPANDGTPRTWFSVLRRMANGIVIQHRALKYDYLRAFKRMSDAGLPSSYANALLSGKWPSLDVLPAAERQLTGIAIAPAQHMWPVPTRWPVDGGFSALRHSA